MHKSIVVAVRQILTNSLKMSAVTVDKVNTSFSEPNFFKGVNDKFFGVTVSSNHEPKTENEFSNTLKNSINLWKERKVRAVWMKVYLEHSYWIPILVENGFTYHHAKPNYVSMMKWLPEDEPCHIPSFAHNTLGVGGFVVNDADELLVVKEKFHTFRNWKLPGGYVEAEENIFEAAVREVKEETGIETEFVSVLGFRHSHKASFGCSDLYFIVILKPVTHTITMCKRELADCQWMKLTEYLNHPEVHDLNKFIGKSYVEGRSKGTIKMNKMQLKFRNFSIDQFIYFVDNDCSPNSPITHKTLLKEPSKM